jgi:ferredoxin
MPQLKKEILNCAAGANLLALLGQHRIPIARSCGGDGVCGTCRVRLEGDDIPPPTKAELILIKKQQLDSGERVACLLIIPKSSKTWVLRSDYW